MYPRFDPGNSILIKLLFWYTANRVVSLAMPRAEEFEKIQNEPETRHRHLRISSHQYVVFRLIC